jgi:hypothetical protein
MLVEPAMEHDMRGMWIDVDIELGQRRGVAGHIDRAAHDDDLVQPLSQTRFAPDRKGDIGKWCNGDQGYGLGGGHDLTHQEVHGMIERQFSGRIRQPRVTQTGIAMCFWSSQRRPD